MKIRFFGILALLIAIAMPAGAAELPGRWTAEFGGAGRHGDGNEQGENAEETDLHWTSVMRVRREV